MSTGAVHVELPEEEVTASVWDPALLRRLLRWAFAYPGRLIFGTVLVGFSTALSILTPLLVGAVVDLVFQSSYGAPARIVTGILDAVVPGLSQDRFLAFLPQTKLWVFAGIFLVIHVSTFLIDWANGYLLAGLGQRVVYDIRTATFRHVHRLHLGWFQANPVGRLVTRVSNDSSALEEMFSVALVTILKDIGMLAGITVVLLGVDLTLGLIALSVVPFMVIAALRFRSASRSAYRRWRAAVARLNGFIAETLSGIRVVKLFGLERRNRRRYGLLSGDYKRHFVAQRRAWAVFRPVNTTLSAIGIGIVIWFGGQAVLAGTDAAGRATEAGITLGVLVTFLGYVELFFTPIRDLTEKFDVIQGAMTAAERIFAVLDATPAIVDRPGARDPEPVTGEVEFREVTFAYEPGLPVIEKISFRVPAGGTVAVVGPTGAGKSTLISLLCRLWEPTEGRVLLDGTDIRDLTLKGLRRNVSVVHQDVFLFAGPILENIRLHDEAISREKVIAACRAVRADEFISRLPQGYDTPLEESGKTLSAGERQLLSFARALVDDPPVLVLDEATASVDTTTEVLIQEALERLTRGRTSIVIAHRLSTIRKADAILVLEGGQVVEQGTHDELLYRRGIYARLWSGAGPAGVSPDPPGRDGDPDRRRH